jgi:hypothetical protein
MFINNIITELIIFLMIYQVRRLFNDFGVSLVMTFCVSFIETVLFVLR